MTYPLMSIAIPAYNHGRFIEDCLASVRDQTYPALELVIIDDGSSDDTLAQIERFVSRHKKRFIRTLVRSRANRGCSATSNECIRNCQGEWVHLLGSDDVLHPNKIMAQWEAIHAWKLPELALVYADVNQIDDTGQLLSSNTARRPPPGPDQNAYLRLFFANQIPNPTIVLRRDAFLEVGGFDEGLFLEDWDCWLRMSVSYAIARVPKTLASYRYHKGNTHRNQPRMLEAMFLSFGKFLDQHGALVPAELRRRSFKRNLHRYWRWAKHHRKGSIPTIVWDRLLCDFRVPQASDYFRYATLISETLEQRQKNLP